MLASDYRIAVGGINHYNKLVVCVVPWQVGRFLLFTCYHTMREELQMYADSEALHAQAALGLLRNYITLEIKVVC